MIVVLVGAGAVVALAGNDFRMRERRLSVTVAGGSLDAVLTLPPDGPAHGLVVMIHGDGPVEATHDGLYRPWFEAAADAGYATLSWSKPGVGGSTGDWLSQTMADRADEAWAIIEQVRGQPDVPRGPVVLWGASQAGWVLPKVAAAHDGITAVVAAGPAVNWLRQGRYNLLAELDHEEAGAAEREQAIAVSDRTRRLLEQHADYGTYRAGSGDPDPMSAARWGFVSRNHTADATADLRAMAGRRLPVLLMLGRQDRNVDIDETEATYRQIIGDRLTVARFDAAHSLAEPVMEDSGAVGLATAVLWPRALLAPGVLGTYREFLGTLR